MPTKGDGSAILNSLWRTVSRRVFDRAVAATSLVDLTLRGFGALYRTESELRAGGQVLNDDRELLPALSRATGLNVCLYLGNRRIAAASAPDSGAPAELGGYADAALVDACLRRGELFRGPLEGHDQTLLVACRPLFATDDPESAGAIGMVEAFVDESAYFETLVASTKIEHGVARGDSAEAHAEELEDVVRFMDDIARRLQLLALNGNIIAAQAGEHGSAFRVVCRELSGLADRAKEEVSTFRRLMTALGVDEHDDRIAPPLDPTSDEA